jgi:2-iminobutanoate/2-iminopropanoate deaminase
MMSTPVLPLSKARRAGNLLFISGQLALRNGAIVGDDVAEQTDLVLDAIVEQLEAHGSSMSAVVKTSVWLTRVEDFATFNAVYARRFDDPYPARSTVISALALPGALVEIDAIADLG